MYYLVVQVCDFVPDLENLLCSIVFREMNI